MGGVQDTLQVKSVSARFGTPTQVCAQAASSHCCTERRVKGFERGAGLWGGIGESKNNCRGYYGLLGLLCSLSGAKLLPLYASETDMNSFLPLMDELLKVLYS